MMNISFVHLILTDLVRRMEQSDERDKKLIKQKKNRIMLQQRLKCHHGETAHIDSKKRAL